MQLNVFQANFEVPKQVANSCKNVHELMLCILFF